MTRQFCYKNSTQFQYYANETKKTDTNTEEPSKDKEAEQLIENGTGDPPRPVVHAKTSLLAILQRIWVWILGVFLCFLVTLVVFPAVTVLVKSTSTAQNCSLQWVHTEGANIPEGAVVGGHNGNRQDLYICRIVRSDKR